MKNMENRSKGEQFFILLLFLLLIVVAVCATGCAGGSCETPKCSNEDSDQFEANGCSIPGIGGCLTSGWGCNCACWPQSCKLMGLTEYDQDGEVITKGKACDIQYYGNDCLGCGVDPKSCYSVRMNEKEDNSCVIFIGSTDKPERFIGCADSCFVCGESDGEGFIFVAVVEEALDIN